MTKIDQVIDNRYKIIEKIKDGGMGSIFLVEDQRLECKYIAKKLDWQKINQDEEPERIKDNFLREGKILANLNHSGLPKVQDIIIDDIDYYIIMEYIKGKDLAEIRNEREVTEDEITRWSIEILDILDYLHRQKPPIIFRDLKPSNIMLENQNKIKLVDFGIARTIEERSGNLNNQTVIGTYGFAPMEQHQGKAETRSDIYALGMTMSCLLTGRNPADEKLTPTNINPVLTEIINKAAQVNIDERYTSAKEMKEALVKIKDNITNTALAVSEKEDMNIDQNKIEILDFYSETEKMYASFINFFLTTKYFKRDEFNDVINNIQRIKNKFIYPGLKKIAIDELNLVINKGYNPDFEKDFASALPDWWNERWIDPYDRRYELDFRQGYWDNDIIYELMTIQTKYLLKEKSYEKADSICQKIDEYKKQYDLENSEKFLKIWSEVKLGLEKQKSYKKTKKVFPGVFNCIYAFVLTLCLFVGLIQDKRLALLLFVLGLIRLIFYKKSEE